MKEKKKLKGLSMADTRGPQSYLYTMTIAEARMAVRVETHMLDIASNMKAKYNGRMECGACTDQVEESQIHLEEECVGFEDIRRKYDLTTLIGKSRFFVEVMIARAKLGRG